MGSIVVDHLIPEEKQLHCGVVSWQALKIDPCIREFLLLVRTMMPFMLVTESPSPFSLALGGLVTTYGFAMNMTEEEPSVLPHGVLIVTGCLAL